MNASFWNAKNLIIS